MKAEKYFKVVNYIYIYIYIIPQSVCGVVLFISSQGGMAGPNLHSSTTLEIGKSIKQTFSDIGQQ